MELITDEETKAERGGTCVCGHPSQAGTERVEGKSGQTSRQGGSCVLDYLEESMSIKTLCTNVYQWSGLQ